MPVGFHYLGRPRPRRFGFWFLTCPSFHLRIISMKAQARPDILQSEHSAHIFERKSVIASGQGCSCSSPTLLSSARCPLERT